MQRRQSGFWLSLGLTFATVQSVAAADPAVTTRTVEPAAWQPNRATVVAQDTARDGAKKSRLRFRTADGTCACTCASGGTSEADISKAQEAREHASR